MSDKTTYDLKTGMTLGEGERGQQLKEMNNKKTKMSC